MPWQAPPRWTSYLLKLGYTWVSEVSRPRNIGVISMPAASAAAGLVALGGMRKFLETPNASDAGSHHERLLDLARSRKPGMKLKHQRFRGVFVFDGFSGDLPYVRNESRTDTGDRHAITPGNSLDWYVEGEARVVLPFGRRIPFASIYQDLIQGDGNILTSNLDHTHSKLCLAGGADGEAPTKARMEHIRFRKNDVDADLSQLLTIHEWSHGTASRLSFFNMRTGKVDRGVSGTRLVIADGDKSFLMALGHPAFKNSDVVGVIQRDLDRDRLEALGARLEGLRQWYDTAPHPSIPPPPGMGFTALVKRQ